MTNQLFSEPLVGKKLAATYKRAGKDAVKAIMEVTAHLAIANTRGQIVPYVIGTRLDAGNEGNVHLLRLDCFNPFTAVVEDVAEFKPVDLLDYYVNSPESGASFAPLEKIADVETVEWALKMGSKKVTDYVVAQTQAPAPAKRVRKPRK